MGENFKRTTFLSVLCAPMWELRSPSSWTLTFDRALIWSLVVVAETVRVGEAPLSTHSQRFIYGPLHFWLWWLQYLSSYLNCIFKDFIQYLHAIQYELSLFCLPTICFLFNCLLFWHVVAIIHKHACQICFRHKMLGMFPVKICFFCFVSWFWWQLNTEKHVFGRAGEKQMKQNCWMS